MKKLTLYILSLTLIATTISISSMNTNENSINMNLVKAINDKTTSEDEKLEIVKNALNEGADINFPMIFGTLLIKVVEKNFKKIANFLLSQPKIRVNDIASIPYGFNPGANALMVAAKYNYDPDIMNMLLNAGAKIDATNKINNCNVFHYATLKFNNKKNNLSLINTLLKAAKEQIPDKFNEFINQKTTYGETALHIAIKNRLIDVVEKLLEEGADPSIINNFGQTAYEYAKSLPKYTESEDQAQLQSIIKILDEHKNKVRQQIRTANPFCPNNVSGIIDIITDYIV